MVQGGWWDDSQYPGIGALKIFGSSAKPSVTYIKYGSQQRNVLDSEITYSFETNVCEIKFNDPIPLNKEFTVYIFYVMSEERP
jgi:hypothetical protein